MGMFDFVGDAWDTTKKAATAVGTEVEDWITPDKVSDAPAKEAQQQSYDLANALAAERAGYGQPVGGGASGAAGGAGAASGLPGGHGETLAPTGNATTAAGPVAAPARGLAPPAVNTSQSDQIRQQQLRNLNDLSQAARGVTPSAAELQGKAAADRAAAQQYGLAVALQGRNAGAALRQASEGAARVQGDANTQAAALRAQEMANARNQLSQALSGTRGQDAASAVADLNAKLTTMGYDENMKRSLLAAQLQAMGYGTGMVNDIMGANKANVDSGNAYRGAIFDTIGNIALPKK